MKKKVYILNWYTDSGDRGVDGYWHRKLTEEEQHAYFKKSYECDYCEDDNNCYIYWDLVELKGQKIPPPLPKSQWSEGH